jgi:transposase
MDTMTDVDVVVTGGVDTHKDLHVAAALDQFGRLLGTEEFPTNSAGYRDLHAWLAGFGTLECVGVEGTGAWGAGLTRYLRCNGVAIVEVSRPNRQRRRLKGKSDTLDAETAGRAVQSGEARGLPKGGEGPIEAIRILRVARRSAIKARTQAANQIHAIIDTCPEDLRSSLIVLRPKAQVAKAARFRRGGADTPKGAAKTALASLARRWMNLDAEIDELDTLLGRITLQTAPSLLALPGVGPDVAGALLSAVGDNPARLRSEASFAALCGVTPLDASSGRQKRHRLNRGGDRIANSALFRIVLCRLIRDEETRGYMARRIAEGKTKKEVIRCLKRYVARQVYRVILEDLEVRVARPPNHLEQAA